MTKREKILLAIIVLLVASAFITIGGYLIMSIGETIKIICPHPVLTGPYEGWYRGESFDYWRVYCDVLSS